ncbi:MAG: hypothetical protein MI810_14710 [Flavobacteriales bacterium]|nr:hypothetical protein [Flavobacteriales bacterium]
MKNIILFISLIGLSFVSKAQDINAFSDANNRLYQFVKGSFQQIYYQQTRGVYVGNKFVAYVDSKGDVYVHHNGEKTQMAQTFTEIHNTDNLLLVKTASVLRVFDQGVRHVLTANAMGFAWGDSLVVYQDAIGGYLKYYYQDQVHDVAMVVGNYPVKKHEVGANVFIYHDNAGNNQIFWRGKFYDLFSSNEQAIFRCGQDVAAFNDPQNQTFTVFDNGYVIDAEPQKALNYSCGNNFIYYKDASEAHKVYKEEKVYELGFDLQNIIVRDSVVMFQDVGITKIWYDEEIYQIFSTQVKSPQIDGGIVAYTNQWGGVSAFVRGKEVEITRAKVEDFQLAGNTIVLKLSRSAYQIWWNGKIYDFQS